MSDARLRGNEAENLAAKFLLTQGYTIVVRRFKARQGEIDIVAYDGDVLVFIEVKSSDRGHESALNNLNRDKRSRLGSAADEFCTRFEITPAQCRFDVITVADEEVHHIRDAFGDWTD